jgi:ribosome-associated toxin RatA of RatAB toxin-antitoxin module
MYSIVADIQSYPGFLKWCSASEIVSDSDSLTIAKLVVSYSKLKIQFTTRNTSVYGASIDMILEEGPFTELEGKWLFQSLADNACKVSLDMKFNFDNSLTKTIMTKVFSNIIATQIDAFQKRAQEIYGPPVLMSTDNA